MKESRHIVSYASLALLTISALSGCATIVKGTSQSVTVNTTPAGAACTLTRDGDTLAVIDPTPGVVSLEKDKDAISVLCAKEGFQDSAGVLSAEFQGMTIGNIVFGGIIGVAVDAASGAMHHYPSMVDIALIPSEFRSTSERDIFFDKMRADVLAQSAKNTEQSLGACNEYGCESKLKASNAATQASLAAIEERRASAIVRR